MEEDTKTVGKISSELLCKSHEFDHSPTEQMKEQLKDYERNINERIEKSKKKFIGDFYIVVETKKERLMSNVLRNYFIGRQSCPTPQYDQTAYKYNSGTGAIEFMWTVPAKDICSYMITNALKLPPEQRNLLEFVMDFMDGTLLRYSKKLNKEQDDSPLLVEKG